MINKRRVKRIRVFLYACIVILILLPVVLVVACIYMLFAIGGMESTMNTVANRVEDAAVSMETSVKRSSVDLVDPGKPANFMENSGADGSAPLPDAPPPDTSSENSKPGGSPGGLSPAGHPAAQSRPVPASVPDAPADSGLRQSLSPNTGR